MTNMDRFWFFILQNLESVVATASLGGNSGFSASGFAKKSIILFHSDQEYKNLPSQKLDFEQLVNFEWLILHMI